MMNNIVPENALTSAQKKGAHPFEDSGLNQWESLKNRVYNLTLYLEYACSAYPSLFQELQGRFSGMPGFAMGYEKEI